MSNSSHNYADRTHPWNVEETELERAETSITAATSSTLWQEDEDSDDSTESDHQDPDDDARIDDPEWFPPGSSNDDTYDSIDTVRTAL